MKIVLAVLSLLVCVIATAQEFDIFDANDFIDPRARGAVFTTGRIGTTEPGNPFYLVRLYGGRVSDYQWRSVSTGAEMSFLHAAGSFYRGDRQLNVKLTAFRADEEADLPSFRGTVQLGQYFINPLSESDPDDATRITGRLLLMWSIEKNSFRDHPETSHRSPINHEFGVETDIQIGKVDGAFIWMRRRIDEGEYVDRISYMYRFRERVRSNNRLHLNATAGAGTERTDGWHCCVLRAVFTATYIIPWIDTGLNIAFAPTYSPASEGKRTHKELAIYLDRTAIARLRDMVAK